MGNLGAYQDIVVKAKDAGGAEMFIESLEKAAAWKAMPKGFAAGVATALATVVVVKQRAKRSEAHEANAVRAKAHLSDAFADPTDAREPQAESREPGSSVEGHLVPEDAS